MPSLRQFTHGFRLHVSSIILERIKVFLQLIDLEVCAFCQLLTEMVSNAHVCTGT
jgi:hypothetical protein